MPRRIIKLTDDYKILNREYLYRLRHMCDRTGSKSSMEVGNAVDEGVCWVCKAKTPDKIMFMYKLWEVHNG